MNVYNENYDEINKVAQKFRPKELDLIDSKVNVSEKLRVFVICFEFLNSILADIEDPIIRGKLFLDRNKIKNIYIESLMLLNKKEISSEFGSIYISDTIFKLYVDNEVEITRFINNFRYLGKKKVYFNPDEHGGITE